MVSVLLGVQVLLCIGIIGLVLLQQGRGADAGASFGGGNSASLFGPMGPSSFLSKLTAGLAILFFANSIALAYLAKEAAGGSGSSLIEQVQEQQQNQTPSDVPSLPIGGGQGTVNETEAVNGSADIPQLPVIPGTDGASESTEAQSGVQGNNQGNIDSNEGAEPVKDPAAQ